MIDGFSSIFGHFVHQFCDEFLRHISSHTQDAEEVTPEERQVRLKKADSIRRMLADTQAKTTRGERAGFQISVLFQGEV